jgi:hypothetical protein
VAAAKSAASAAKGAEELLFYGRELGSLCLLRRANRL